MSPKVKNSGTSEFGGSTHCLVFRPGAIGDFAMTASPRPLEPGAPLVLVRSHLATVAPKAPPPPLSDPPRDWRFPGRARIAHGISPRRESV